MRPARRLLIHCLVCCCLASLVGGCGGKDTTRHAATSPASDSESKPGADLAAAKESKPPVNNAVESPTVDPASDSPVNVDDQIVADQMPSTSADPVPDAAQPDLPDAAPSESEPDLSKPIDAEDSGDASDTVDPSTADPADAEVAGEPAFRILVPTTSGPLLVEADIRIGDQPLMVAFEKRIQQVLDELSESSELTWPNLFEHVSADPQQFGRSMVNATQSSNMIRLFDKNRNRKPDHDEVARFLFRSSRFAGPFRLRGSDALRGINRSQSKLFAGLDRNQNHLLEAAEIEAAAESIERLDQNGDRRIEYAEVVPPPPDNDPAWNNRRSSRWGEVAMDLAGYIDWKMLSYTLDESSRHGVFGSSAGLISRIDQNRDGSVDPEEARSLLGIRPDVRLLIQYPAIATGQGVRVEIVSVADDMRQSVRLRSSGPHAMIEGDSFRLLVQAIDTSAGPSSIPPEAFAMLDANNDGGLDEMEIPPVALREYSFDDLDADKDGKLTARELREGMMPKSPIWSVQVRSRGAETRDAMFCWLDENQDRVLSMRELGDITQRLSGLATSEGVVRPSDIPDSFLLLFGRGDPERDQQLFSTFASPAGMPTKDSRPRWAQSMDSNRDGDIGPLEFLGTTQQFESLDANNDGFIDTLEAGGSMDVGP